MKRTISAVLICLLVFTMLPLSAFADSAQEEQPISDTELILPEEEEIYEGTGSLAYAFDDSFIRDYVDNEQLDEAGHVARIHDEEELDTYVFLNRDGTKSVYYMDDNVRYVDENGERVEKDLTLVRKNKGYSLKASDVKLWFPDVLSDGISVKYDNFHLTLYPQGIADTEEAVIDEFDRITYPGVFGENTVLAYTPTLSGLKEDIIVTEYTGQLSYDFLIHTHGMRILEQDGKWVAKKPGNGNKETFELGAVQIYDFAGNFCVGEMTVTAQNNGSKYILTLTAPEEFMTDPDTVYPVTIDPTIEVSDNITGSGAIEDSVIYSGTPAANYGGFTYLTVGNNGTTYGVGRALFRLPGLTGSEAFINADADNILSVYFYAWDASGHDDITINLHPITSSSWTESGVTWNNTPGFTPTIIDSVAMPSNEFACFDITSLAKAWKSSSAITGFALINPNETSETYKKVPCSSETAVTTRRPYVVMTYAAEASIVSSRDYVTGGTTLSLSVTSNGTVQSVVWASSDSSIATITQNGLLFGSNAGSVIITATVTFSDNTTCVAEKNFFVTVPNGVYRISNKNSGYYLNVKDSEFGARNEVNQVVSTDDIVPILVTTSQRLSQMWKISYIGDGYYSIRPMHKLNMGLWGNGVETGILDIGETDFMDFVAPFAKWKIDWNINGYVIKRLGGLNCALQTVNASTSIGALITDDTYDENSDACHWGLSQVTNAGSGIILYDAQTQKEITDETVKLYVAPEETVALSSKICTAVYASYTNNQTVSWDYMTSGYIELDGTRITGLAYSGDNFNTIVGTAQGLNSNRNVFVRNYVTAIQNGTYYVQNKKTKGFVTVGNGLVVRADDDVSYIQKWTFTHLGDGYYSIEEYNNDMYISVDGTTANEGTDVILSGSVTDSAKWKVEFTQKDTYKLIPKLSADDSLVAAVNENLLVADRVDLQPDSDFTDGTDEWELYNLSISIVNYYDSTFDGNAALINNIAAANTFVEELFYEVFGLTIQMDGAAIYDGGSPADSCEAADCGKDCGKGYHCRDVQENLDYLYEDPSRENSHIYVLWANRDSSMYCNTVPTHEILTGVYASTIYRQRSDTIIENLYRPTVYVHSIPDVGNGDAATIAENQQKAMGLILAHEIAHVFGVNEIYDDDTAHKDGDYTCIMERFVSSTGSTANDYKDFYDKIIRYLEGTGNGVAPFCEDCENELEGLIANLLIEGN